MAIGYPATVSKLHINPSRSQSSLLMPEKSPINPKCPHMLHGSDYNPEPLIETPEIWDEDMRLMKLAHCNVLS